MVVTLIKLKLATLFKVVSSCILGVSEVFFLGGGFS